MLSCRLLLSLSLMLGLPALAMAFELPPDASAQQILGDLATGPNYRVESPVTSDGLIHQFTLVTADGTFLISGDALMHERIREMGAVARLDTMSKDKVFQQALGQAAQRPIQFGKDLLNDPDATLKRSASDVSRMFNRVGTGIANRKSGRGDAVNALLGVEAAKRRLAADLGVDPYSDFPPLAARLSDIASASAAGGLSMKVLTLAIPGGVGMAVGATSTAENIRTTLADKTSAEIAVLVRGQLGALGVPADAADRLIQNRAYSPADLLVISNALTVLGAHGADLFVAGASGAVSRDEAFFHRERARLLAVNATALGIGDFVPVGGFTLNRLADGRILALFPLDSVAWTDWVSNVFTTTAGLMPATSGAPVLAISGTLTPEATRNVTQLGWTIVPLQLTPGP